MKIPCLPQVFTCRSTRIAAFVCCLAFLLVFTRAAQAQFSQIGGTNSYNFYDFNGLNSGSDGTDPSSPFSGQPLGAYYDFESYPDSGVIPATGSVTVNGTAVNGSATFALGPSPTGVSGSSFLTLALTNLTTLPDEVRLDWTGTYEHTVASSTPIVGLIAVVQGTATGTGSYYALAGGEAIGASTAYFQNNGFSAPSPLGPGPWYGGNGPGNYSATATALFSPNLTITGNGYIFQVSGYLDLVVDPGTVQVQIEAIPPPAVGIGTYSNSPVVFFPTVPGTNYVVQMSTNLATGNWVPVTNGVPFSGIEITNAPNPAFFRLQ